MPPKIFENATTIRRNFVRVFKEKNAPRHSGVLSASQVFRKRSYHSVEKIKNTFQIYGDFTKKETQNEIKKAFRTKVDVVLSDMAVNTTGIKDIDAIYTSELCKEAMLFSKEVLTKGGQFVSKIFMGSPFNEIIVSAKAIFKEVRVFKPKSSRKDSKESFIVCKFLR